MDKIVRRVTVVDRSGPHPKARVVYSDVEDDDDDDDSPDSRRLERHVRQLLKAEVVAAQEAYQRHLDSVAKGGDDWLYDSFGNLMRARRKAMKELRASGPFGGFGPFGRFGPFGPPKRADYDDEED